MIEWDVVGFWSVSAFMVAGVLEYVKGFFRTAPSMLWRLLLPVSCIVAAIVQGGTINSISFNSLGILAVSQLCHELIIKAVKDRIAGGQRA